MSTADINSGAVNTTTTYTTTSQPTDKDDISLLLSYISIGISGITIILIVILVIIVCYRKKTRNFRGYKPHLSGSYVLKNRRQQDVEFNIEKSVADNSLRRLHSHQNISRKQTNDLRGNDDKPEMRNKQDGDYANQEMMANNRHTIYNDRDLEILNSDLFICSDAFH